MGLHGDAFWRLSPYELSLQFQGARQRMDGWYELGLFVAWHTAMFTVAAKVGKLPPLEKLLARGRGKAGTPAQTPQALRSVMQQMSAQYGIPLQHRPNKKKG